MICVKLFFNYFLFNYKFVPAWLILAVLHFHYLLFNYLLNSYLSNYLLNWYLLSYFLNSEHAMQNSSPFSKYEEAIGAWLLQLYTWYIWYVCACGYTCSVWVYMYIHIQMRIHTVWLLHINAWQRKWCIYQDNIMMLSMMMRTYFSI